MLRERVAHHNIGTEPDFRWRGGEITRIEGFTDAVFAFAVTLLVVSLEVPKTFDELLEAMRGFIAFAICFLMLMSVWYWHYRFFRRYGLQDTLTLSLNAVLLFVVLFYVYPLKFLFTLLIDQAMGQGDFVTLANGTAVARIEEHQFPLLMTIYGLGYVAACLIFAALYFYAYRRREELELNHAEVVQTQSSIQRFLLIGSIGLLSVLIALIGGVGFTSYAGYTYILIWPVLTIHGRLSARLRHNAVKAMARHEEEA